MSTAGGVTVFCDPALKPAVRALGSLADYSVAPLCAPAPLMLAQLARHTRDDVLFTLTTAMDAAGHASRIRAASRIDGFANPLVLACLAGTAPSVARARLRARLAVTDATVISGLDGRAVLAANGISSANVWGVASTADAAFLLLSGAVDLALLYQTEVRADARLAVAMRLDADPALTAISAALNAKSVSPNAGAFLALLQSPAARTTLSQAGLAVPA